MGAVEDAHALRRDLIEKIEKERESRVFAFVLSDRKPTDAQIAEDSVRPIYDHLRSFGKAERIDLFLFSIGGAIEIPWRIVSMIREFTDHYAVLIPYKAMSAATLIALGADEIVMGRKGELGPIDPQIIIKRGGGADGTAVSDQMSVEDVMSYLDFVREKSGKENPQAVGTAVNDLAKALTPWVLGSINRIHSHIREVARKMLTSRSTDGKVLSQDSIKKIIETLTEKTYQHGHAFGRGEAKEIGLNVVNADEPLETMMWDLLEAYEEVMELRNPIDVNTFVPKDDEEHTENVTAGCIESTDLAFHFTEELFGSVQRAAAPQLQIKLNLNLQLPAGVDVQAVPAETQTVLQGLLQKVQEEAEKRVREEVKKQMPITGWQIRRQKGGWRKVQDWPVKQ